MTVLTVEQHIEQITEALSAYGYVVTATPLSGSERLFAASLEVALDVVLKDAKGLAVRYGFKGRSRKMLAALHLGRPVPAWGVEVAVK